MTPTSGEAIPTSGYSTSDRALRGPHGDVRTRLYTPVDPLGVGLVWLHGGAFCMNDLDVPEADGVARVFASSGVTVINVDYRLAVGGIHFPVPGDDVYAAWMDSVTSMTDAIPAHRWHIGGASAGGTLAAATCLRARDEGGPLPASAVLVYPVLHDRVPDAPADLLARMDEIPEPARFTREESDRLNLNYVGDPALLEHPYAFPAHAELEGFPATLIVTSELDTLRPSGQAFAAALALAGSDVALARERNVLHGHLNDLASAGARRTIARILDWLRRA